jgi:adenosine deaminase
LRTESEYIRGLPKAELHVHIEGTLEPELAFRLAGKHGIALPYASVEALRGAYRFADLQSFLDVYYAVAAVLLDEDDFFELTRAYLERARADNVVHAEIFFDPQAHTARGIALQTVLDGMTRALRDVQQASGMTHRLIPCILRHLSAAEGMRTLEQLLPYGTSIAGIGLDSSEAGHPPHKFAAVFDRARAEGLPAVAHAGEEGPPAYIIEALDLLHVRRIDHGVRCEEDPALMRRLARERIPLTVCPLSNLRLRVVDRMEAHNLGRLLDQGLCVTVNSDDPAYFGGYVADNYLAVQRALGLSDGALAKLARNSFEASFLPTADKVRWIGVVDAYARAAGVAG